MSQGSYEKNRAAIHEILTGSRSATGITTDALHTQRQYAQAVLDAGGEDLMFAKDDRPRA